MRSEDTGDYRAAFPSILGRKDGKVMAKVT
jgi:hypothetical protein